MISLEKRIPEAPHYLGISRDQMRADGRFRLLLYGALNAMGLIGPECNGIAVLDTVEKAIVCDEIGIEDTGYFGPSTAQVRLFDHLVAATDPVFRAFINSHKRSRYLI